MIINDNGIEREATVDEIAYYEAWNEEVSARTAAESQAQSDRIAARQVLLERLGITEEEAQLLLGGN